MKNSTENYGVGNTQTVAREDLSTASPKDKPWDRHRALAVEVSTILWTAPEDKLKKYADRLNKCAPQLWFNQWVDTATGEISLKLNRAFFCKVRNCPVCQWRRSLMWKARVYKALPKLAESYPAARWVFLTLTVKNCAITDLRTQLSEMGKAWKKLLKRKEFGDVLGWMKSLEVTRGADGSAHPHFHCLLLVKSTYFQPGHYVPQPAWAEAWRQASRLDYLPIVDVRIVKSKGDEGIGGAVAETLKYAVKAADMTSDPKWFLELTRQVQKTRAVASGGVLKELLKPEESSEDLLNPDPDASQLDELDLLPELRFDWQEKAKKYSRKVG